MSSLNISLGKLKHAVAKEKRNPYIKVRISEPLVHSEVFVLLLARSGLVSQHLHGTVKLLSF